MGGTRITNPIVIAQCDAMRRCFAVAQKVSESICPILLIGESGTGKTLCAQWIHAAGRLRAAFISIDCGSSDTDVLKDLIDAPCERKMRRLRRQNDASAQSFTLFLNNISELPRDLQKRLANSIQETKYGALTGSKTESRIIAATNRDPVSEIREGRLTEDLYYRLSAVTIRMPPLRERKEDIPLLVEHILLGLSRTGKRRSLSAAALLQLTSYEWPGNIRELQTFLEGAIALSSGPIIQPNDLPPMVGAQLLLPVRTLEEVEREAIKIALARTGGNKIVAARSLGIGKTTMYRKLQKYKAEGRKGRGK